MGFVLKMSAETENEAATCEDVAESVLEVSSSDYEGFEDGWRLLRLDPFEVESAAGSNVVFRLSIKSNCDSEDRENLSLDFVQLRKIPI